MINIYKVLILSALFITPMQVQAQIKQELEKASLIDPTLRSLESTKNATFSRFATTQSPIAGAPVVSGSVRSDTRGLSRGREVEGEISAPLWNPNQRGATRNVIDSNIVELDNKINQRRWEILGLIREAFIEVDLARKNLEFARSRESTARLIANDMKKRQSGGDLSVADTLFGQNELLAAQVTVSQAQAQLSAATSKYKMITNSNPPRSLEANNSNFSVQNHVRLMALRATLDVARANQSLVAATPRENMEVGVFGRYESGSITQESSTVGLRLRMPLSSESRNIPRRAFAQNDITIAQVNLEQAKRVIDLEVEQARQNLTLAQAAVNISRQRKQVSDQQLALIQKAFQAGEASTMDLFRIRQIQIDANSEHVLNESKLLRARLLLNQVYGNVQ